MTAAFMRERERETPGGFFLLYFFNIFTRPPAGRQFHFSSSLFFSLTVHSIISYVAAFVCVCVYT